MTAEKKLTIKRIIIFTILSYLPQFIIVPLFGYAENTTGCILGSLLVLFSPAAAHILTRLITKEGLTTEYLGTYFKGNMKYYILAIAVPFLAYLIGTIAVGYIFGDNYSLSDAINGDNWFIMLCVIIQYLGMSIAIFFISMGEEYGWRAYLTPKLEEIMSEPAALIVSGIIWALWHAPEICQGMNFGTGYKFFPIPGLVMMCVFCIPIGSFFTWLVKKTGSVHAASLSHAVLDLTTNTLFAIFASEALYDKLTADNSMILPVNSTMFIPMEIASIVFMILLCRKKRTSETA